MSMENVDAAADEGAIRTWKNDVAVERRVKVLQAKDDKCVWYLSNEIITLLIFFYTKLKSIYTCTCMVGCGVMAIKPQPTL